MLDELLKQLDASPPLVEVPALRARIDAAAAQKDASVSRLFWYTDLSEALKVAAAEHKPVLSLRLLGRLDESLSCANSRFFRATLYANQKVADYLRHNYVLHWQCVRPAPKMTVDLGDGRKIETTITGNSIHYVLSPEGKVIDAIPGLYGPAKFLELLQADRNHDRPVAQGLVVPKSIAPDLNRRPAAVRSAVLAVSKLGPEASPLKSVTNQPDWVPPPGNPSEAVEFDATSIGLIRSKLPPSTTPQQADACILNLRFSVAADQQINHTRLRPAILQHIADCPKETLDELNAWVYSQIFIAPLNDPWSGLYSPTTFNGLDNAGLITLR